MKWLTSKLLDKVRHAVRAVRRREIYTHVIKRGGRGVKSPLDD